MWLKLLEAVKEIGVCKGNNICSWLKKSMRYKFLEILYIFLYILGSIWNSLWKLLKVNAFRESMWLLPLKNS